MSAKELAGLYLARIQASQPALNAFITVDPERTLAMAAQADARIFTGGHWLPPTAANADLHTLHHLGAGLFGIAPTTARVALSRMVASGEVVVDAGRYRAAGSFARRQQRWFRRDPRIAWLAYDSPSLGEDALRLWASSTRRL